MSNFQTPKGLKYVSEMLPSSLPADQNHRLFYSENGSTYSPTGMNRVIIPINCDGFIDTKQSYLKFTITNRSGAAASVDGNAYNFIQRLTIYGPNAEVLEMIDNYGALMTAFLDVQTGNSFRTTTGNYLMGTSDTTGGNSYAFANNNDSATFQLPLICGLFNNERFLPCKFINGPIRIELLLQNAEYAMFGAANTNLAYDLSNVGYFANVLNLQESFYENFRSVMQQRGGIQWAGTTYRRVGTELQAVNGQQTVTVTDANKSIKSIIALLYAQRLTGPQNADRRKSSVRATGGCTSYYFTVGGNPIPTTPITVGGTDGTAFAEVLKAFGLLSAIDKQTSINKTSYSADDNGLAATVNAKFIIGLDCENYTNENLESGLNTSSGQPVKLHFTGNPGAVLRCDVFYMVDCIFTLTPEGYLLAQH